MVLICADVIRPGVYWLLHFAPARRSLATEMARTRDGKAFSALSQTCIDEHIGLPAIKQALTHIAVIMASKAGQVGAVEVGDCVELMELVADLPKSFHGSYRSLLFYQLLRWNGVVGADAPASIEMFFGNGQPT